MHENYTSTTFPEPRWFQDVAHESLRKGLREGHRCQMLMAPTGSGKCLGKGTPVLLANGQVIPVEDVQVGDRLMGPDGKGRVVLSLGRGREQMYRVVPVKGDPYVVNASHILSLRKTSVDHVITLADGQRILADDEFVEVEAQIFARSSKTAQHCLKGWRSDAIEQFEYEPEDEELGVPPYILGAWLGDGTLGKASISKPRCRMVEEWIAYGRSIGYACREIVSSCDENDCPTWLLTNGQDGYSFNIVASWLDILGVLNDKHVPDDYKFGPAKVRLEVLAGLIDSDGHVSHKGVDWISKSERLAHDFAFIARSLGLACYISAEVKGIKSIGFEGLYWRCHVSGDTDRIPTRDKRAGPRLQKKRHLVHGIRLEPLGVDDYYGFEIDGDGLFLLGDFTVTHNTFLGLRAIHESLLRGKKAIFVCDRTTLIEQTSATADRYGLSAHGVIQAKHWRFTPSARFQIASAQTLARRQWPEADLIVIDEAHTQLKAWTEHIQNCRAAVIGLSATPFSTGLGRMFTNLVNAATMRQLIADGILVPIRVLSCTPANMAGAATAGGEWTDEAAAERGMQIAGDVVIEWTKYGENRKTIIFGASIAHCEDLCRKFQEIGVAAAVFTSRTDDGERKALLDEFRRHDSALRILISVEALAKGFDVPDVSCVVDCRPLRKSLSTAIQMWGRGLRTSPDTGKTDCLLLDHSGNIHRFREDFERIFHDGLDVLDAGEKLDKVIRRDEEDQEKKGCPSCGFKPFFRVCMSCGHEYKSRSMIEAVPGEMQEIRIGTTKYADDSKHLWEQACSYARGHSAPEKQQGRACNIYRSIIGKWPPRGWSIENTPSVPITRAVLNKITANNIAFARRKAA